MRKILKTLENFIDSDEPVSERIVMILFWAIVLGAIVAWVAYRYSDRIQEVLKIFPHGI
jgi:cell division protein FtsL